MTEKFGPQQTPVGESNGPQSPVMVGEDTRDRIINTYRDEIKNHQARERDYKFLAQVINDLQRRIRSLENNIDASHRENEQKLADQDRTIENL
jgi:hypothetical protein